MNYYEQPTSLLCLQDVCPHIGCVGHCYLGTHSKREIKIAVTPVVIRDVKEVKFPNYVTAKLECCAVNRILENLQGFMSYDKQQIFLQIGTTVWKITFEFYFASTSNEESRLTFRIMSLGFLFKRGACCHVSCPNV